MKFKIILFLFIMLLFACKHKDPAPVAEELIINPGADDGELTPNGWYHENYPNSQLTDRTSWATAVFVSPSHSLEIAQPFLDDINYSFWAQRYDGTTPVGKDMTLSVKIKGDTIVGTGAFIALYADGSTTPAMQTSVSDPITGTFDWTTYTIKLPALLDSVETVRVHFFFQTNTTGKVYFDDASLTHN